MMNPSVSPVGFKQFQKENGFSYLVYDQQSLEGLVVNPRRDLMEEYREFIATKNLKPVLILNVLAPGSVELAEEVFKREYQTEIFRALSQERTIAAGRVRFQIREGQGRVSCLFSNPNLIFWGGELPVETLDVVQGLEGGALIFPSQDRSGLFFSTVGVEKSRARSGEGLDDLRVGSIRVEKYALKLREQNPDSCFIDVREPNEFATGRMPGTVNIPLSELGFQVGRLQKLQRLYVSCLSGRRSQAAAKTLCYIGCPDVIHVQGGFQAWKQADLPVE